MGLKKPNHNNMVNIRKRLLSTRGKKCEECGFVGYVEVHHKVDVSKGGLDHESNLVLLCQECHNKAHGKKTKNYFDKSRRFYKPEGAHAEI